MSITDFLLARISEDEAVARAAIDPWVLIEGNQRQEFDRPDDGVWEVVGTHPTQECRIEGAAFTIYDEGGHHATQAAHIARHDPARVLAECAAKRAIVEEWQEATEDGEDDSIDEIASGIIIALRGTLCTLAAVYADHQDYRDEWRAGA